MNFAERLHRDIAATGPIPVAQWMARCNAQYYGSRDPLGRDFTTAPEISQMFGELIGAAFADCWQRAGSPSLVRLVELGPGRATLVVDLLRATASVPGFHAAIALHLVETSPVLRAAQAARVSGAQWHDDLGSVPDDAPLLLVANEFFDALPVRQIVRTEAGWRELHVGNQGAGFAAVPGPLSAGALIPAALSNAPPGSTCEISTVRTAVAAEIGTRLKLHGGGALIIDYGYAGPATGDTLQAVRANAFADPFGDPGDVDLTAHVDFHALAAAAGVDAHGPVGQGDYLRALGITVRAAALVSRATPAQAEAIGVAAARLTETNAMGKLFKVLGLTGDGWPVLAGFAA